MTEREIILRHLALLEFSDGRVSQFTGFTGALGDARGTTGRNMQTGKKVPNAQHGSWLGALGYLVLLNQIGNCFRPLGFQRLDQVTPIVRALKYFAPSISELDALAIYALRCSFAHDYSLCNWSSFPNLQHLFVVGVDPGPLVSLPGIPWDGEFRSPTRTTVNLEKLGDLVEDIVEQLRELARGNQLEVDLKGGITELQNRYSFVSPAIV